MKNKSVWFEVILFAIVVFWIIFTNGSSRPLFAEKNDASEYYSKDYNELVVSRIESKLEMIEMLLK